MPLASNVVLLIWVLSGGFLFIFFCHGFNAGETDGMMSPDVEAFINEPIGVLVVFVLLMLLGPLPLFMLMAQRVNRVFRKSERPKN